MKQLFNNRLLIGLFALIVGLGIGIFATRLHYKQLYKNSKTCGSVSYYDKTGKTLLWEDHPGCK